MPHKDPAARRAYQKAYFEKHKKRLYGQATEKAAVKRKALACRKAATGCVRCGESDPRCLQFHHRDPAEKSFTIGARIAYYDLERLMAEADKCEVLCANCHFKEHNGKQWAIGREDADESDIPA